MKLPNKKYLNLKAFAVIFLIIISFTALTANFLHIHGDGPHKYQNCPACLLLNSINGALTVQYDSDINYFQNLSWILPTSQNLINLITYKENSPRAPPFS